MFRKINNVFRPNHQGYNGRDGGFRSEQDYHSACTVRLVRSTSMLDQNCLEYLEELVALRRQYTKSVNNLKSNDPKATLSAKKKPAPPPPTKDALITRAKPSAPPIPSEADTLQFFDEVIASIDNEPLRKPHIDDGHADVDFIVATSSSEHDLHSNWVLRVPRVTEESKQKAVHVCAKESAAKKKNTRGSTSSRLRLQRNPIHLPKVVASAFQTLRFKPKLKTSKAQDI